MGRRRKYDAESTEEDGSEDQEPKKTKSEDKLSGYEQIRDQRIKENKERMQNLGLFDLSLKLKSQIRPKKPNPFEKKTTQKTVPPNQSPPRRSSRIKTLVPISYKEVHTKEKHASSKDLDICIPEGTNPEVYTEDHEKLLGDSKTSWDLCVDGYDSDGNRIYDAVKGLSCHQCRQKTLGERTYCSKCESGQGQLCGDCLYTRYGENVMETYQNPKWICLVCRGICNCSRCRKAKGWMPTGNIYRKVSELGFKSVAHYLFQTRRTETCLKSSGAKNPATAEESLVPVDTEETNSHEEGSDAS